MIPEELLVTEGTGMGIIRLAEDGGSDYQLKEVADNMELGEIEGKDRVESLLEYGVLEESAELIDNEPRSVYNLTEDGERLAETLRTVRESMDSDLLFLKGTSVGIIELSKHSDSVCTIRSVKDGMGLSHQPARRRTDELEEEGIIDQSAKLVEGRPTRVYNLTEYGEELADRLASVID